VAAIRELAIAEGFEGEFLVEEIVWRTADDLAEEFLPRVTEVVAAKYFIRSIIINRGLGVTVSIALLGAHESTRTKVRAIQNLCTVIAGADPISLPIEINSDATNVKSYGFSLPDGDKLLALWTDGTAVDDDLGAEATLIIPNLLAKKVVGIDVLHSFEQELATRTEDGDTVIQNLLVKDYPIILRLSP
jgi:hypothetical protein